MKNPNNSLQLSIDRHASFASIISSILYFVLFIIPKYIVLTFIKVHVLRYVFYK